MLGVCRTTASSVKHLLGRWRRAGVDLPPPCVTEDFRRPFPRDVIGSVARCTRYPLPAPAIRRHGPRHRGHERWRRWRKRGPSMACPGRSLSPNAVRGVGGPHPRGWQRECRPLRAWHEPCAGETRHERQAAPVPMRPGGVDAARAPAWSLRDPDRHRPQRSPSIGHERLMNGRSPRKVHLTWRSATYVVVTSATVGVVAGSPWPILLAGLLTLPVRGGGNRRVDDAMTAARSHAYGRAFLAALRP